MVMGYPLLPSGGQTENITFLYPSDAGSNKYEYLTIMYVEMVMQSWILKFIYSARDIYTVIQGQ